MRSLSRRSTLLAVLPLAAAALAVSLATPAGALEIKSSDVHAMGYPTTEAIAYMGDLLSQWTDGRLTVKIFHSMQLGGEKEALEQVQLGALEMTRVSVGVVGPIVDDFNAFNLPYVFRSIDHMHQVVDGEIGQELLAAQAFRGLVNHYEEEEVARRDAAHRAVVDKHRQEAARLSATPLTDEAWERMLADAHAAAERGEELEQPVRPRQASLDRGQRAVVRLGQVLTPALRTGPPALPPR